MSNTQKILKAYWGYPSFRFLQEDIIQSVLEGNDTLALLPTGGGKSICFQVPALALEEKLCLVVSPLIALMKDQVYQLNKRNIPAEALHSGMNYTQIQEVLERAERGQIKFLYLSPERLKTEAIKMRTPRLNIGLLAIDEAHCISQWGYDFRPPYLEIADFRKLLPENIPVIALTATATPSVKNDIQEKLGFKENREVFQKSFARANLSYSAFEEENKLGRLLKILQNVKGSAVVYVRNRKKTKDTAEFLQRQNVSADFYHAGLSHEQRNYKQNQWIVGKIRVIVATNAFGMGIDKADVRVVVHLDLPDSLEAYYQEAGRAGRDEKKAYAVALFNQGDIESLKKKIEQNYPSLEVLKKTYQALANYLKVSIKAGELQSYDFDFTDFTQSYGLPKLQTYQALKRLSELGLIEFNESFYKPSQIKVLQNTRDFYKSQLEVKGLQYIGQLLLREYGGKIYDYFVQISEKEIAKKLKTKKQIIQSVLEHAHNLKIVDYQAQNESSQITFLTPRYDISQIPIDIKTLEQRKNRDLEKIKAVIHYVLHQKRCRTALLLDYFGEFYESCGVCDICLKKKKAAKNQKDYTSRIKEILQKEAKNIKDLQSEIQATNEEVFLEQIRELMDKSIIQKNEEGKFFWFEE